MSQKKNGATANTPAAKQPAYEARPSRLIVRPAVRSDLTPLRFFFDALLRRDYFIRQGQLEELVNGPHHQVYIAEIDAVLVGVAVTTRGSRLANALVHPAYRQLGIGRALVERTGVTEVSAKLDMSTGDPRRFYEALGFKRTGKRNPKGNIELMRRPGKGASGKTSDEHRKQRSGTSAAGAKRK